MLNLYSFSHWLLWIGIALAGLFAGSAINILAYHIPRILQKVWRQECYILLQNTAAPSSNFFSIKTLRLHCVHCSVILPAWMNLPLLRELFNGGRCDQCGRNPGRRYSYLELATAITFLGVVKQFSLTFMTVIILLLVCSLLLLALIDCTHYLLPDCITLTLIWLGLLSNTLGLFVSASQAVLGAMTGYISLWLIGFVYKLLRGKEGMGRGDYKLLAVFGAWWGINPLAVIVFVASISGLVVGGVAALCGKHKYDTPLPFGPYLVAGGLVVLLFGKTELLVFIPNFTQLFW